MAWYDNAVFYHIYPLGLAGAPKENDYGEPVHRLSTLSPWIGHMRELGCNALYIGPLFESVGHGYETTDYRRLDSRLGTNDDLVDFVAQCHRQGIRVVLDGVFNHVGRDFFAFRDLRERREASPYRDWFCDVDFSGDNEYGDGFSYGNWGGHNLLVKLNHRNDEVRAHLLDAVRLWVDEFDIDGIRLDAADVLDHGFMRELRALASDLKPEFWLMGEVIHGEYARWANDEMLHSVTDYNLHKALYSAHDDRNYFEIAHTVKRLRDMGLNRPGAPTLYGFADNHDVERIFTRLRCKAHIVPTYILLFSLPDIPSIYYGSEFGIEGRKELHSDYSLRPALSLADYEDALERNPLTQLIARLGHLRQGMPALFGGDYRELLLTTGQYAFERMAGAQHAVVTVNNADEEASMRIPVGREGRYAGTLFGESAEAADGFLEVSIPAASGEIWVEEGAENLAGEALRAEDFACARDEGTGGPAAEREPAPIPQGKAYGEMTVEELQSVILERMGRRGEVTERMRRDVMENIWHDSLVRWAESF